MGCRISEIIVGIYDLAGLGGLYDSKASLNGLCTLDNGSLDLGVVYKTVCECFELCVGIVVVNLYLNLLGIVSLRTD